VNLKKLQSTAAVLESVHNTLQSDNSIHVIVLEMDVGGNNQILNDSCVKIVEYAKTTLGRDVAVFFCGF